MFKSELKRCSDDWRSKGVEAKAFTTNESADDLAQIRKVLGVDKADIVAFSYGTRLALADVARHESSIGRVVLQGVNGPGLVVKRPDAVARKLSRITGIIANDSAWSTKPDLIVEARKARQRLAANPVIVTIANRKTGTSTDVRVGREGFDAIASLNLDDARLPALIVSVASGDNRILAKFVESAWNGLSNGTAGLMARAVNCSADRPAHFIINVCRWYSRKPTSVERSSATPGGSSR